MKRRRRRRSSRVGLALVAGVAVAIAALLVASPRHRAYYSRLVGGAPGAPEVPAPAPPLAALRPVPAPPPAVPPRPTQPAPASPRPPGYAMPIPSEPSRGAAAPPAGPKQKIPPPSTRSSLMVAKVPRGGPGEQVAVKIVDEIPARLPFAGVPLAWELKEFAGRAHVEVVLDEDRVVFRLASERSSYALYRDVILDVKDFPLLTWSWKVTKLPAGADIRERTTDDQAGQVYVIFPRWPFPRINSDVVGYIWDSRAPPGLRVASSQSTNVKLVVLQSGSARLGQWVREERNVHQDYVELFGKEPPRVGQIAIMIDSNDTRSEAEAFVDDLAFRRATPPASSAAPSGSR
ncbi:MAG: DUF3047 domain-containing protein [Candidatus Rokubacteria bacterium]|nr:DUF3047 domain-containing protein [Candidatus Rokubacteria bacterium]